MKDKIKNLILTSAEAIFEAKGIDFDSTLDFDLIPPKDTSMGDLACNVAFKIAKPLKSSPKNIAEELCATISEQKLSEVQEVSVAGPGFINITLKKDALGSVLVDVFEKGSQYGSSEFGKGKKAIIEFVSANPTGPLTIAHGRQAAIGDSMARILQTTGHEVISEYYLNDAGNQIRMLGESVYSRYCEKVGKDFDFPENGYKGAYISDIANMIFENDSEKIDSMSEEDALSFCSDFAKNEIMGWIKADLSTLDVNFQNYFSEQTLYENDDVERSLKVLDEKGWIFKNEGATWFRSTDLGDDKDRVVKKSDGNYTYLAPDIAYHLTKYERGNNLLINLWGPDHHGYIARLKAACQALGYESDQIHIGIVQLTTLYRDGEPLKMSTRAGEFVTLKELYEDVGVDATRFFFIMRRQESPLDFDLELAKQKSQDNPVYYLQYAHARIASIIRFSEREVTDQVDLSLLSSEEEAEMIGIISQFPDFLISASQALEPYRLVDYLRQLSASFHRFYSKHRVVSEDEEMTKARLLLSHAVKVVLANGLRLLGVSRPESM